MKQLVSALSFLLLCLHGSAQWSQLTSGTSSDLNSIHFADNATGWVAGEDGKILHTVNGGTSWAPQVSGTSAELYSIYFTDAMNGWAAGEHGTIRHTTNGGTSWTSQASGTVFDLYAIHFFDATLGIAAGETGVLLRTVNGGATWSIALAGNGGSGSGSSGSSGSETVFTDVQLVSSTFGYACGKSGYFMKSTDGGVSWTAQTTGVTEDFAAIHFPSAGHGYIAYELGKVKHTTGNGTFTSVYAATSKDLKGVWFVSDNRGWVVGDEGRIYLTADGGTTWHTQNLATVEEDLRSVHFPSVTTGYIAGKDGTILKLSNAETAGIGEQSSLHQLSAYPNPVTGTVTVQLKEELASGTSTVIVTDAAGRIISELTATEPTLLLPTDNWTSGYYTLRVVNGQQTETAKILKQ